MTFLFTLTYAVGGESFLHLLTDDNAVIAASAEFFPWALVIPVAGVTAFIFDGVFIGLTATRGMLAASVVSACLFFLVYLLFSPSLGNHALWLAQVVYLSMRGAVQGLIFMRKRFQVG